MYKNYLNDEQRAEIDAYTDNLLSLAAADGFHETYYTDTIAGAQIHLDGKGHMKIAVRMKLDGTITHETYNK